METGIYLSNLEQFKGTSLDDYRFVFGNHDMNGVRSAYQCLTNRVPDIITHLYYGCEFCEYLIPEEDDILRLMSISKKYGLSPVFVTPAVSDFGLKKLKKCFTLLKESGNNVSVVVNDYGVAELLRNEYSCFAVIAGRLLDKLSHDARVTRDGLQMYYGDAGIKYASIPGNISKYSLNILKSYGIQRAEYDLPKTGICLPETKMKYSLYWPFHYLTTGRICLFRAMSKDQKKRFLIDDEVCTKICRKYELELRKPLTGFQVDQEKKWNDLYLFQKGNTLYYLLSERHLVDALSKFDRIVIEVL